MVLRLCPKFKSECYLSIAHSVMVTYTSFACIFRGDDTAFTCAASVAFFVVDAIDMMLKDGLFGSSSKKDSAGIGKSLTISRKMDYIHHMLGICFGLIEHYYENDLCPAHVGCAFIYVQWHEISTPFYNMFRLTGQQVWGGLFALTFFFGEWKCGLMTYLCRQAISSAVSCEFIVELNPSIRNSSSCRQHLRRHTAPVR